MAASSPRNCPPWISRSTSPASARAASCRSGGRRQVVRDVRERTARSGDPVAEGPAALVRDLSAQHLEPLEAGDALVDGLEGPVAAQPLGSDREIRRGHHPTQARFCGCALVREDQPYLRIVAIAAAEERQALKMVPVQVGQQDRAPEWLSVQCQRDVAGTGAGVQQQRGCRRAVGGDGHARGVTADPDELGAGGGH